MHFSYAGILKTQLPKGNNDLTKSKYITFVIDAEDIKTAKPCLERIENTILSNLKLLGVAAASKPQPERESQHPIQFMAIFILFTTQELFQDGSEALYYVLNVISNNLIMVDRKKLKAPMARYLVCPAAVEPLPPHGDRQSLLDYEGQYYCL